MKILIDLPVYEPLLNRLHALEGVEVVVLDPATEARELPVDMIRDVDLLLCTVPPSNHAEMKQLQLIQIASAGYTQLIGQGFVPRGVRCCNALGVFDVPIAEWNIAMMVQLARNMKGMQQNQRQKIWNRSARFQEEIRGKVIGLWGYGGIGRETARLAKAMGLSVFVLTRGGLKPRINTWHVPGTGDPEGLLPDRTFTMEEKDLFLSAIDFLIMAIPQTAGTEGIVGEAELRLLKPSAFLLNPARGPLIREAALIRALREQWFAGAALDTHYYYPLPPEHPLWEMDNVILTPHISGSSASPHFLERVWNIFFENVQRFRDRRPLLNELSADALQGN
ncbi:D-2-hydroxyacid dehydrogenase [Niabella beijingensis]|uniref:D-2-hydroxyacid dehydrogenase n=1 Tax=Niabella beijingensis TaxID=2872700 RepID=UPI001CC1B4BA|nr:D-2-hydroxyacid dehydrogenase [Niabella beijingensis]MBZ4190902.1 D-2-hydroxyacid dehydrogenase [Niabella beijingensis]